MPITIQQLGQALPGMQKGLQDQFADQAKSQQQMALQRYLKGGVDPSGQYQPGVEAAAQAAGQKRNSELAQQLFDENKGKGGGTVNVNDSGVSIGAKEFNPWMMQKAQADQHDREVKNLLDRETKTLGKGEEGLKAMQTADAFLQNPNGKNLSDVKAMSVQLQGLPARAFGAEAKASGFDPSAWSNIMGKINQWDGNVQNNPLTQDDLNTFRANYGVMRGAAVKKFDADNGNFWNTEAPQIGKHLPSEDLQQLQQGYKQKIQGAYGDYHQVPWQQPNNPGQPAADTQPPQTSPFLNNLKRKFNYGGGQQNQAGGAGKVRVRRKSDGATGSLDANDPALKTGAYEQVQ